MEPSVFSVLSAAGVVASEEGLLSADCSALALASILAAAETGVFYPTGGYAALQTALARTVRAAGGEVLTDVPVKEIVAEKNDKGVYVATGVRIDIASSVPESVDDVISTDRTVVSGLGAICTYTRLLPANAVTDSMRSAIAQVCESRPKVQVVLWLSGTAADLGLTSTDYVEIAPQIELPVSNDIRDKFAGSYLRIWSPSAKDPSWSKS